MVVGKIKPKTDQLDSMRNFMFALDSWIQKNACLIGLTKTVHFFSFSALLLPLSTCLLAFCFSPHTHENCGNFIY